MCARVCVCVCACVRVCVCVCVCADKDTSVDGRSKQLWQVKKKVYFLTVWARENYALLPLLARLVEAEQTLALRALSEYEETKEGEGTGGRGSSGGRGIGEDVPPSGGEHKLIEELS